MRQTVTLERDLAPLPEGRWERTWHMFFPHRTFYARFSPVLTYDGELLSELHNDDRIHLFARTLDGLYRALVPGSRKVECIEFRVDNSFWYPHKRHENGEPVPGALMRRQMRVYEACMRIPILPQERFVDRPTLTRSSSNDYTAP